MERASTRGTNPERDDAVFAGTVIQVGSDGCDLVDSLIKAKDLRFKKRLHLSTILGYFRRYKHGRDRVPPLELFQTAESESDIAIEHETRETVEVKENIPPRTPEPLLPPLPNIQTPLSPLSPPLIQNASTSHSRATNTCNVQRPMRDSAGRFAQDVEPFLESLRRQGIDPFSTIGHTHLLLTILSEMAKMKQRQDSRTPLSAQNAEVQGDEEDFGLPLSSEEEYHAFVNRVNTDKVFKRSVMKFLRRLGGETPEKMINRMVDALLKTQFQSSFNQTGRDYEVEGRPKTKISTKEFVEPFLRGKQIF